MDERETINEYDLVEIIRVPEHLQGVIEIGDIGVVVEKYDPENFKVECLQPGGPCNWLEKINIACIRLRSRDPYGGWAKKSLLDEPIMRPSVLLGTLIGAILGGVTGAGLGAISGSLQGILVGLVVGLVPGAVTGALTAALTVKIAGTSGGIGVGYFTGMVFGGVFGMILGALTPTSLRTSAHTDGLPVLDALMIGRLETAILCGFLLSVLATVVGVWIGGRNQIPRNLKERYRP